MMSKILLTVLLCLLVFSSKVYSNDGYASLTPDGIVFSQTDGIKMQKELLRITKKKVEVEYVFRNLTDQDIETIIAFPIPGIRCNFERNTYPHNFRTEVNSVEVQYETEVKATVINYGRILPERFNYGQDITDHLSSKNLPVDCRDLPESTKRYKEFESEPLSDEFNILVADGLAYYWPDAYDFWNVLYETKVTYFWKQLFPKNSSLTIKHEYTPSVGGSSVWFTEGDLSRKIPDRFLEFYQLVYSEKWKTYEYRRSAYEYVDYILTTANTWSGPIEEFSLVLPYTGDFVFTDLQGPIDYDDGSLIIRKKNFSPTDNLTVYFSNY